MDPKKTLLIALAGAALAAGAPAAFAGDRDDGWRDRPPPCNCSCNCEEQTVSLPASFFEDSGGVGPAFIDTGGGGGGFVFAGASASASAFASASARVSVNFSFHGHPPHMPPPMHMKKGWKW